MTNEQLVLRIQAGENVAENMEQLYLQVKAFIHTIAWKYRDSGEMEDLEQEGYLALYSAVDGYDPAAGANFLTYAAYHIRQRMQRYLQNNGSCLRLPVHCLESLRRYQRFCSNYRREHGCEPPERLSAAHLGLSLEQLENVKKNACLVNLSSLDSPVTGIDGGEDATLGELTASAENLEEDVLERIQQEQLRAVLWDCVDNLEGQQPEVIRMRYQENMTREQVGQCFGMTPEAARQTEAKALRELRKPRNSDRLRPYFEEERIRSMGLSGTGVGAFERTWTSATERAAMNLSTSYRPEL